MKDKTMNRIFHIWLAFCLLIMLSLLVYIFQQCGTKAFLYGNGAFYAAITGVCEEE
jgi:hypothetical protein